MRIAYQPVVAVLGDTLAVLTRRERGVWSLHDTNEDILALPQGRYKALPHINHSMSQVGLSVRSLIEILAEGSFDDVSCIKEYGNIERRSLNNDPLLCWGCGWLKTCLSVT